MERAAPPPFGASLEDIHGTVQIPPTWWRRFLAFSGPALLISVGYMDPGNWGSDIAAGSQYGYRLLWVLVMSNLMALLLQSLSTRLGVVFTDPGAMTVAPYEVVRADHWAFAGTGLRQGDLFGTRTLHERYGDGASGHETDKVSPSSPAGVRLLARGLNPDNGGAHLVHFTTPSGGEVFSAGSITYPSALLCDPPVSAVTANVLRRFLGESVV